MDHVPALCRSPQWLTAEDSVQAEGAQHYADALLHGFHLLCICCIHDLQVQRANEWLDSAGLSPQQRQACQVQHGELTLPGAVLAAL